MNLREIESNNLRVFSLVINATCTFLLIIQDCLISMYNIHVLTFNTPLRILPPATPPFNSSTSDPGLLTSKDLITSGKQKKTTIIQDHQYTCIKEVMYTQHVHYRVHENSCVSNIQ